MQIKITEKLIQKNVFKRICWAFGIYAVLTLSSFAIGYFLLPEGIFKDSPIAILGNLAAMQKESMSIFAKIIIFNFGLVFFVGTLLNIQRVRNFPTGYVFIIVQGIMSGLVAGTNSFASQIISPYTVEGWLVAIRIGHLEFLGYTCIIASTIALGLQNYNSWLPWKGKAQRIKKWQDIRFTRQELVGICVGIVLILIAAYNEANL